jgi:magnesium chelatase subunit D
VSKVAASDALAAALFAVDPAGLGGVVLRGGAGPQRDAWLALLVRLLPPGTPLRRVPLHADDDRLLGGLDLSATLRAGRPVAQRGLLAEADGGVVLLAMAERLSASTAAIVSSALDTRELVAERQGLGVRSAVRIGVVALDEGLADDESTPAGLRERLAFHVTMGGRGDRGDRGDRSAEAGEPLFSAADVASARDRVDRVGMDDEIVEGLCSAALALGIASVRAPLLACRAARAAAALDGRERATAQDAALAAALVLAPRATQCPAASPEADAAPDAGDDAPDVPPDDTAQNTSPPDADPTPADADADRAESPAGAVDDVVLAAALAAMPPGLLATLALGPARARHAPSGGRVGAAKLSRLRGRPVGVRRGEPQHGARLHLIETLRAAAPWQALRRRESAAAGQTTHPRIQVRREDFHVWRFKQRSETTTVFVVDASGSSALNRLAEAKGAVELLLAVCYVRRDSVALIAFRGAGAELLLPPTRSLVRAKRSLAGLPGGGGTPLAAGIASAHALADAVRRRGATPVVVLLTDGRANIARDGAPGRARAAEDALAAARALQVDGFAALLLDTSPQPQPPARDLAAAMGARYVPLPYAGAAAVSQVVRAAGPR